MRTVRWIAVVSLVVAVMAAGSVSAAAESDAFGAQDDKGVVHCVVEVVGQRADGELVVSDPACFDSFAEAMVEASSGALRLPAGVSGDVVFTDPGVGVLASSFTLGIHYDGYNGTGSSLSVVGSSCTGGYWNTPGWFDNRISSSYNGCARLKHWDYAVRRVT